MSEKKSLRLIVIMLMLILGVVFIPVTKAYADEADPSTAGVYNEEEYTPVLEASTYVEDVSYPPETADLNESDPMQESEHAYTEDPVSENPESAEKDVRIEDPENDIQENTDTSNEEYAPIENIATEDSGEAAVTEDSPVEKERIALMQTEDEKNESIITSSSEKVGFSVFDNDDKNSLYKVNDFASKNGDRYIYLPAQADITNVILHYTGDLMSVSRGAWDPVERTVQVDFSEIDNISVMTALQERILLYCLQSSLPSVSIALNGTTLNEIHQDKNIKYKGTSVVIYDPETKKYSVSVDDAEIKGRGNSTWTEYEKKGYQIKLSSKTSVLGMDKAKKWILLANSSDPSLIRTTLVYDIAKAMNMGYVTDERYVDLWIDGDYRGIYLIGEKVEIDKNRLNLTDPHGIIVERDNANYAEEDHWFVDSVGNHYTLKDSVTDDDVIALDAFKNKINSLNALLAAGDTKWKDICSVIDAESFAKFYIINEFFSNDEVLMTSYYMYINGANDLIHAGPLWDFDSCMGIQGFTNDVYYVCKDYLYNALFEYPEFAYMVMDLYGNQYKQLFMSIPSKVASFQRQIRPSAEINYIRWRLGATTDSKGTYSHTNYVSNVNEIQSWLGGRLQKFSVDRIWEGCIKVAASSDIKTYTAYFNDGTWYDSGRFAVWSNENGQDDVVWYKTSRCDGTGMYIVIPVSSHNALGRYTIHLYLRRAAGLPETAVVKYFNVYDLPAGTYVYGGIDYTPVFDPSYYLEQNPDVKAVYGNSINAALAHFARWGMAAGRKSSINFELRSYMNAYADLRAAYGTNLAGYYLHYIRWGRSAGRVTKGVTSRIGKISSLNGVDYSLVYDYDYYSSNADVKAAFGDDDIATLANFIRWGMAAGRQGITSFDVHSYRYAYSELRKVYGMNYGSYYMHYIWWGHAAGLDKTTGITQMNGAVTALNGIDYRLVYDYNYFSANADVKAAFGDNDTATLANFVRWGMAAGRAGSSTFNVLTYRSRYADLRAAYGNDLVLYYLHYIKWGFREGRIAV